MKKYLPYLLLAILLSPNTSANQNSITINVSTDNHSNSINTSQIALLTTTVTTIAGMLTYAGYTYGYKKGAEQIQILDPEKETFFGKELDFESLPGTWYLKGSRLLFNGIKNIATAGAGISIIATMFNRPTTGLVLSALACSGSYTASTLATNCSAKLESLTVMAAQKHPAAYRKHVDEKIAQLRKKTIAALAEVTPQTITNYTNTTIPQQNQNTQSYQTISSTQIDDPRIKIIEQFRAEVAHFHKIAAKAGIQLTSTFASDTNLSEQRLSDY